MAKPTATLGDTASHPGQIVTACEKHYADNGRLIARKGDIFNCMEHGPNPIIRNVSTKVMVEGEFAARDGSVTQCGAVIIASATSPEL